MSRADLNAVEKRKVSCFCSALNSDSLGVSHGLVTVQVYNLLNCVNFCKFQVKVFNLT